MTSLDLRKKFGFKFLSFFRSKLDAFNDLKKLIKVFRRQDFLRRYNLRPKIKQVAVPECDGSDFIPQVSAAK